MNKVQKFLPRSLAKRKGKNDITPERDPQNDVINRREQPKMGGGRGRLFRQERTAIGAFSLLQPKQKWILWTKLNTHIYESLRS